MRGRRGQREEAEGFGLSGESLGAEEEGGAKIFWTLPAPNSALAAISLLGPGPGVDGSQRTGNCPPHSPPRKSCPRCPPRQSDSRSPPQRLRERGGAPTSTPNPAGPQTGPLIAALVPMAPGLDPVRPPRPEPKARPLGEADVGGSGAGARPRPGSWGRLRGAALGVWEPRGRVPAPLSQRGASGGPSASWAIGNGLLGGSGGVGPGRKTLE